MNSSQDFYVEAYVKLIANSFFPLLSALTLKKNVFQIFRGNHLQSYFFKIANYFTKIIEFDKDDTHKHMLCDNEADKKIDIIFFFKLFFYIKLINY